MPHTQLVPSRLEALARISEDRGLIKRATALQRQALGIRAEDAARRYVATGRIHDIRELTKDALEAAGEIGDCLKDEVMAHPYFARELEQIASRGARGLRTEIACFIEEGH